MQILESVLVGGVKAVSTVHFKFALRHLLGLLDLVLGELHLVGRRIIIIIVTLAVVVVVVLTLTPTLHLTASLRLLSIRRV